MYQSPIEIIQDRMRMEVEGEVFKAVQNVGVHVDKDELLKALQYDRGQYTKGYKEGYAKAIDEFAERLKENVNNKYRHFLEIDTDGFEWLTTDAVETHIDETVKEMKGEGCYANRD